MLSCDRTEIYLTLIQDNCLTFLSGKYWERQLCSVISKYRLENCPERTRAAPSSRARAASISWPSIENSGRERDVALGTDGRAVAYRPAGGLMRDSYAIDFICSQRVRSSRQARRKRRVSSRLPRPLADRPIAAAIESARARARVRHLFVQCERASERTKRAIVDRSAER